jgi:hypothetical protein
MTTELEDCTTEEQISVKYFFVAKKDLVQRKKEMVHVYGGKCLSHKAAHVENKGGFSGV